MRGPDRVNYSDGNFTNNTNFSHINPQLTPPLSSADIVQLYASKHNPFVYFRHVQQGTNPMVSFAQMAGFDGASGLWGDLASGKVANFSYIVPNQCNDQQSPVWTRGHSAIVVIWDENDYSVQSIINQVVAIVDTNYGFHELQSGQFYTHFSLLRSIEGGLGIPCLNHACDASTNAMTDLFGEP